MDRQLAWYNQKLQVHSFRDVKQVNNFKNKTYRQFLRISSQRENGFLVEFQFFHILVSNATIFSFHSVEYSSINSAVFSLDMEFRFLISWHLFKLASFFSNCPILRAEEGLANTLVPLFFYS